jgi:hypothetical protein
MNCFPIFQSNDPQHSPFKIINHTPESKTIVFLRLYLDGVFDDHDTPFFFNIRSLPQYFILEIIGEPISFHDWILYPFFVFVHRRKKLSPDTAMYDSKTFSIIP